MPPKSQKGKTGYSGTKSSEKSRRNSGRKRAFKTRAVQDEPEMILGDLYDSDSGTSSDSSTWNEFGERILDRGIGTGSGYLPKKSSNEDELEEPKKPVKKRAYTSIHRKTRPPPPSSLVQNAEVKHELEDPFSTSTHPHLSIRLTNPPKLPKEIFLQKSFSNIYTNVHDPNFVDPPPRRHKKKSHEVIPVKNKVIEVFPEDILPQNSNLSFQCKVLGCSESFKSLRDLGLHQKDHSAAPPMKTYPASKSKRIKLQIQGKSQMGSLPNQKKLICSHFDQRSEPKSGNISAGSNNIAQDLQKESMIEPVQYSIGTIKPEPDEVGSVFQPGAHSPQHIIKLEDLQVDPLDLNDVTSEIEPTENPLPPHPFRFDLPEESNFVQDGDLNTSASFVPNSNVVQMYSIIESREQSSNVIPTSQNKILPTPPSLPCKVGGCTDSFRDLQALECHLTFAHICLHSKKPQSEEAKKSPDSLMVPDFMPVALKVIMSKPCSFEGCSITAPHDHAKGQFPCTYPGCTKIYDTLKGFRGHFRASHSKKVGQKILTICDKCGRGFSQQGYLKRHLNKGCFTESDNSEKKLFTCDFKDCGKKFKTKMNLRIHLNTHQIYNFLCEFCGVGYPSKTHYENHKVWAHFAFLPLDEKEQNEGRLAKLKEDRIKSKEIYKKKQEELREKETEEERQKRRENYKELRIKYFVKNPEKMREYYKNYQKCYLKRRMQNEEEKKALIAKRNEYYRQRWARLSLEERRRKNSKKNP